MRDKIQPGQTGFVPKMGCQVNLMRIGHLIKAHRKTKYRESGVIFFDFKSAFDLVDHDILLHKVNLLGLSEQTVNIIRFCLNNSFIKIGEKIHKLNRGVPQCSLLSPFLFNIYIDDLLQEWAKFTDRENVLAYADDTAVIFLSKEQLERIIHAIKKWCLRNKMELNCSKSGIIFLENDKLVGTMFKGFPVVKEYKYLGYIVNRQLNPSS